MSLRDLSALLLVPLDSFCPCLCQRQVLKVSSGCIFPPFTFNLPVAYCPRLICGVSLSFWQFSRLSRAPTLCVLCSLSSVVFTTSLMILVPLFSSTFWENISYLLSTSLIPFLLKQGCFVSFLMPIIILLLYF